MHKMQAEQASMQSFLNCYLRETDRFRLIGKKEEPQLWERLDIPTAEKLVICPLRHHGIDIIAPVNVWSPTGRHLFQFPWFYTTAAGKALTLDLVTLVSLVTKELAVERGLNQSPDDLVFRAIQSCQHIENYLRERKSDEKQLYGSTFRFLDAEQSLVFGHLLHPTPKSRQGLSDLDQHMYSPETKGRFALRYFRAHRSIVRENSAWDQSATNLVKNELLQDPELSESFKKAYLKDDEYSIIPIHPLQAEHLLQKKEVKSLIREGLLTDLGIQGRAYYPTSSIRTVYHPKARFMLKCSLNIKITNSVRLNLRKELERGVEVARLMKTKIGAELEERFPFFRIIQDPAYLTIHLPGKEESGFEVVLRENPFTVGEDLNVTLIAGLGQDPFIGNKSRLASIITELAKKENRSLAEVSLEWFRRYLSVSLQPLMWLYQRYGIALEAHQQNSLVGLSGGYPDRFYYRDNQGYYYSESTFPELNRILPGISETSQTKCADEVADERLRYYLFINHLFGLINAFGTAGLAEEEALLAELRQTLSDWLPMNRKPSTLLTSLLEHESIPGKANLLTRLHDMDELVGPMESQSVYVPIPNPLVKGVKNAHATPSS